MSTSSTSKIITDSAADFEPQELSRMNITCIPLTVFFGEIECQENVSLTKDLLYKLLDETTEFPKTSQAAPQILMGILDEAKMDGDEVIYITLASALSGTYQSALMAKELLEYDGCYMIDSQNATGGQQMLVEYAVKLRDAGKTAAEIVSGVKELRHRIVLYACMDTLEYLYCGGRIPTLCTN